MVTMINGNNDKWCIVSNSGSHVMIYPIKIMYFWTFAMVKKSYINADFNACMTYIKNINK